MKMNQMLQNKIVQENYANDTMDNISKQEAEKIIKDENVKKTIALNLKDGDTLIAHYVGNSIVGIKKVDIHVKKVVKNNRMIVINGKYTLHMYCECYVINDDPLTISVTDAAKELELSRNRVYQLIHDDIIELFNGKPILNSVIQYKRNRRPVGRPEGTFKKHLK